MKKTAKNTVVICVVSSLLLTALVIFSLPIACTACWHSISPLDRPTNEIKRELLEITPIGTKLDDIISTVESKIEQEEWESMVDIIPKGCEVNEKGDAYGCFVSDPYSVIGVKTLSVHLGYGFMTYVYAKYAFDENDVLIDVFINAEVQ